MTRRPPLPAAAHAALFGLLLLARGAAAAPVDFSAGSWIIPMDACNQPSAPFNGTKYTSQAPSTIYGTTCPEKVGTARDGLMKAYGLVYRLLQNKIPVYYILNSAKTAVDDVDLTITSSTTTPVGLADHTTGAVTEFMKPASRTITYRGAPFLISAVDVPKALALLSGNSTFTQIDDRTARGVFQDVFIHVAKTNILQAPVRAMLKTTPPKLALLDINNAAITVLQGYLKDMGLFSANAITYYPQIGDIFTEFNDVTDFTGGGLVAGGFSVLWAPHWYADANTPNVMNTITKFVDAGGVFMAECLALGTAENQSKLFTTTGKFTTNQLTNPFPQANTTDAVQVNPDPTTQAWVNPLAQTGDFKLSSLSGAINDYIPAAGNAFRPFINVLLKSKSATATMNNIDLMAAGYKEGDPTKGLMVYLGGHAYGSDTSSCGTTCTVSTQYQLLSMERLVMNSIVFLGQQQIITERTRSSPVVYQDGKTYLGSYVQQSMPAAAFPPWQGHFREYPAGALQNSFVLQFGSAPTNWDTAKNLQQQAQQDSRTIFTASVSPSGALTYVPFTTGNANAVGLPDTTIAAIRAGGLGGIDHSIPAIIGPSSLAGSPSRPTVAYVGALDGMLHAILVSGSVQGRNPGDELWAYIPPSQIQAVAAQASYVDGNPVVGDAFIAPSGGNGTRTWRTLLGISGRSTAGMDLDVLDVTDPLNPTPLWSGVDNFTDQATGKTYVMGRAQGAAMGAVTGPNGPRYAFFIATDNTLGTGGNGFNLYALDAATGSVIWRFNYTYKNDTTFNDVPASPLVIDSTGTGGNVNTLFFGDIKGKVWMIDAAQGPTPNQQPLYDAAAANGNPTSVNYPIETSVVAYRDPTTSHLRILGVTGSADWVPDAVLSYLFTIDLGGVAGNIATLLPTERTYGSPTVAGNSVYLITSQGDLQGQTGGAFLGPGYLIRVGLGKGNTLTRLANVTEGASEVWVDGAGNVVAASTTGLTVNSNPNVDNTQAIITLQNQSRPMSVRGWLDIRW